jgi:hypothetical protein
LRVRVEAACAGEREWPAGVAAGVRAAFDFAAECPRDARLLTIEALADGEQGQALYRSMLASFAALLRPGRDLKPGNADLPAILESANVGGVALLVIRRLDRGDEAQLPALAPDVIQFVLTPYLGTEEARRVALAG